MTEIVNLRLARKAKARSVAAAEAAANRTAFGLSKQQKRAAATETARSERILDGARREP